MQAPSLPSYRAKIHRLSLQLSVQAWPAVYLCNSPFNVCIFLQTSACYWATIAVSYCLPYHSQTKMTDWDLFLSFDLFLSSLRFRAAVKKIRTKKKKENKKKIPKLTLDSIETSTFFFFDLFDIIKPFHIFSSNFFFHSYKFKELFKSIVPFQF